MKTTLVSAILLIACLLGGCRHDVKPAESGAKPASGGRFLAREITVDGVSRRYQVFVPSRQNGGEHPPVILFLHGSGERGGDGIKQTQSGLGPYVRQNADTFPAIVVFPQVPDNEEWYQGSAQVAFAALDAATDEFSGDRDRTYLTGLSMGGYGSWDLALREPQRFAAIVPICGGIKRMHNGRPLFVAEVVDDPDPYATVARRLRDMPIWLFHGAQDNIVPPDDDRKLFAAFRDIRAPDVHYTEFAEADHNAWDPAYAMPELWSWLFEKRRRSEAPVP